MFFCLDYQVPTHCPKKKKKVRWAPAPRPFAFLLTLKISTSKRMGSTVFWSGSPSAKNLWPISFNRKSGADCRFFHLPSASAAGGGARELSIGREAPPLPVVVRGTEKK